MGFATLEKQRAYKLLYDADPIGPKTRWVRAL